MKFDRFGWLLMSSLLIFLCWLIEYLANVNGEIENRRRVSCLSNKSFGFDSCFKSWPTKWGIPYKSKKIKKIHRA